MEIIAVLYWLVVILILVYGHCEKDFKKYTCNLSLYTDILFPGYSSQDKNCLNEMFGYLIFIKIAPLSEDIVHFQLFVQVFKIFISDYIFCVISTVLSFKDNNNEHTDVPLSAYNFLSNV